MCSDMKRVLAQLVAIAVMGTLSGCAGLLSGRYGYSCGLGDQDLLEYQTVFVTTFPMYAFDMNIDECDSGSSRGFRMKLVGAANHPSAEKFADAGCARVDDESGLDQTMYVCRKDGLQYELTLEDQFVYLSPLAPG